MKHLLLVVLIIGVGIFTYAQSDYMVGTDGGTWCGDTQALLPKFYLLMDAAGIGGDQLTFVAVDRQKHALNPLPEEMHLAHTPTFIILKGGKEVGRVVEWGKNGQWETELGDIVSKNF